MRKDAEEVFAKAGVPIEGNEKIFERTVEILGETMAELSVMRGLSYSRIEEYESQKQSLVDELKEHFAAK